MTFAVDWALKNPIIYQQPVPLVCAMCLTLIDFRRPPLTCLKALELGLYLRLAVVQFCRSDVGFALILCEHCQCL